MLKPEDEVDLLSEEKDMEEEYPLVYSDIECPRCCNPDVLGKEGGCIFCPVCGYKDCG